MKKLFSFVLLCLLLSVLLVCSGCNGESPDADPTPTQSLYSTDIPDSYEESINAAYPQIVFAQTGDLSSGLTARGDEGVTFTRTRSGSKNGVQKDNIILQADNPNKTLYLTADGDWTQNPAPYYALMLNCYESTRDVALTVRYRNWSGETIEKKLEVPQQRQWQRLAIFLENPAFGADGDISLVVSAYDPDIYFRLAAAFLVPYEEKIPEVGSVLQIQPKYGNGAAVFAAASVTQFGALGDGCADDTSAFTAALAYADSLGGGTVYVPEGHYVLTSAITMPAGVALIGELDTDELNKTGAVRGSVLCCYAGKGDESAAPMFTMNNYSTLQRLAFWYPEQKLTDGKPIFYPYTIEGKTTETLYGCNLSDLLLVNAYRGIHFGNTYNVLEVIRNIYGTPLSVGYQMGGNADIARVEGMTFSPWYWSHSALPCAPNEETLRTLLGTDASAMILERVDWAYLFDLGIDGYKTGLTFRYTSDGVNEGSTNGSIYNADIVNCRCGILVEYAHEIGLLLTASRVCASGYEDAAALVLNNKTATAFSVLDSTLESTGEYVIYDAGSTALSVSGSALTLTGTGKSVIRGIAGDYTLVKTVCSGGQYDLELDTAVYACHAVNCAALRIGGNIDADCVTQSKDAELPFDSVPVLSSSAVGLGFKPGSAAYVALNASDGADITDALEDAFSRFSDGGTVYIPAGSFRVSRALTVPAGVEVRGSLDAPISTITRCTRLLTDVGQNDPDGEALFTLSAGAGLVGLAIQYENQNAADIVPYSYTVRGNGAGVYVRNCALVNSYQGIDLAANRCDRHLVESVVGVALVNFARVGGGSEGGVIRDVLTNPAYWQINDSMSYVGNHLTYIALEDCTDEILYADFLYAGVCGLRLGDGAKNVTAVTFGADSIDRAVLADGNATATLVNSQIACFSFGQRICAVTDEAFTGRLSLLGISTWASPSAALSVAGGEVSVRGGALNAAGTPAILQTGGRVSVCALYFAEASHALFKTEDGSLRLSGNIYRVLPLYTGNGTLTGCDEVYEKP